MIRYFIIVLIVIGCSGKKSEKISNKSDKPTIAVVNYPLYYFASSITGDMADIYFPKIDGDPAYWEPSNEQIIRFQNAHLILANGAGYAGWMDKISLPSSKIINTSLSFQDQWIALEEGVSHNHGPEGAHVHQGTAFTTWLNFEFAQAQANTIYEALIKLLPEKQKAFDLNFQKLKAEILGLDNHMKEIGSKLQDHTLIASHPVYQYLGSAYNLDIKALHWEPEEMPNEIEWGSFEELAEKTGSTIMLWEAEPIDEIKNKLKNSGTIIVVFEPCGNRPGVGDFIQEMNQNIENLQVAIDEVSKK